MPLMLSVSVVYWRTMPKGSMPVDSAVLLGDILCSSKRLVCFTTLYLRFSSILSSIPSHRHVRLVGSRSNRFWSSRWLSLLPPSHYWHRYQLAWVLIPNFSCSINAVSCPRSDNMGWRYLLFTLGGLTLALWGTRFFVLEFLESPRYLIGRGRDQEAVTVIRRVAVINKTSTNLNIGDLTLESQETSASKLPEGNAEKYAKETLFHIRSLFSTRKMASSTALLILIWGKRF